jgi:hypothetical protein
MSTPNLLLIILLLFSWGCSFLDITTVEDKYKKLIFNALMIFALCVGYYCFPYSVDYRETYLETYYNHAAIDFSLDKFASSMYDIGFFLFVSIIKALGGSIRVFYLICCSIILIFYRKGIFAYTPYALIAWFLIYSGNFELQAIVQIRQGLACAIFLYSLKFIKENKLATYIICIILASLIHKSLIITLFLYPLCKVDWDSKKIILLLSSVFVFTAFPLTHTFFDNILPSFGIHIAKWEGYSMTSNAEPLSRYVLFGRFFVFCIFLPFLYKWKNYGYNQIFLTISLLGILVLFLFRDVTVLSLRLSWIFMWGVYFAPTSLFDIYPTMRDRCLLFLIVTCLGFGLFIHTQMRGILVV